MALAVFSYVGQFVGFCKLILIYAELKYREKSQTGAGGKPGRSGGFWRSKTGVEHFGNSKNHENQGFKALVK